MKKIVLGFLVSLLVMMGLETISKLVYPISEFFIGWTSCVGYYATVIAIEKKIFVKSEEN